MTIPRLGFGTYRLKGKAAQDAVLAALELGYRHVDTAQVYDNEADVGRAIERSRLPREDLFITTKVWVSHYEPDELLTSLEESLERLRVDQVDLVLIHWPAPDGPVPMSAFLPALAEAREQRITRQIGLSNFNIAGLRQAIDLLGPGALGHHQIEVHPWLANRAVVEFSQQQGLAVTAFSPLACGALLEDPVLQDIARARGATVSQVSLAWLLQRGINVIPASSRREHMKSNLAALKLSLSAEDVARIDALDRNARQIDPPELRPEWD